MFDIVKKMFLVLSPAERWQGAAVTALMMMQAVTEVTGIVSITPFLAVLGNPDAVQTNKYLALVYNGLGFTSSRQFLIAMGVVAFFVLAGASVFRAIVQYARARFTNMRRHTISLRLLEKYMRQPYVFFLRHNTSHLAKMILAEVDQFTLNALVALMQFFSYLFVSAGIIVMLLAVSMKLAMIVAGTLGLVYGLISWRLSATITELGNERKITNGARYQITTEILGGVKELKVLGREQVYLDAFEWPSLRYARVQTNYQVLSETPRYMVEIIGFCALLLIVTYLMRGNTGLGHALPIIGLYAFAAYRLLPAAQNIYNAMVTLRYSRPAVETIYNDIAGAMPAAPAAPSREKLQLRRSIELRDLGFAYPEAQKDTLSRINVTIPAWQSTGIVGATGAGKSTLVDLILGVLEPTAGGIYIDGVKLDSGNMRAWQNAIGYVPQQIFLADDTVARNIAFGIPEREIDRAAVEAAAAMAQIDRFVLSDLPQGYDTMIGERGVRLSGGQRQRIGIARALYHNPDVLLLDEATSALDGDTEADVMQAIENLSGRKTVIMIAHRRNTLRACASLIHVEGGCATIAKQNDLPDTVAGGARS